MTNLEYSLCYNSVLYKRKQYFLFGSIAVDKQGKIEEEEYSSDSDFIRKRVIYKSGLCEEYNSMHIYITKFGIMKVVYPDGQQFTNELYDYDYGYYPNVWNAIGEETYAIQNKSIPYLLGDQREMKEYIFVTEDGLFNTIDLGWNYRKKIRIQA